jgi:hypothetical protein
MALISDHDIATGVNQSTCANLHAHTLTLAVAQAVAHVAQVKRKYKKAVTETV